MSEGGREGGSEGGREGGREGVREGGREGGRGKAGVRGSVLGKKYVVGIYIAKDACTESTSDSGDRQE